MSESGLAEGLIMFQHGETEAHGDSVREDAAAELVRKVSAGEQEAFNELYRKFSPMVHGIVLARGRREDADDLVQEVFLTVFRKIDSLNDPDALGSWIASIARRCVADAFRGTRDFEELPDDVRAAPSEEMRAREVFSAIRSLPEAYSETLVLRLVEGMTGPEISEVTGLTHDSVRVNLHRGMKMLREALGEEG